MRDENQQDFDTENLFFGMILRARNISTLLSNELCHIKVFIAIFGYRTPVDFQRKLVFSENFVSFC